MTTYRMYMNKPHKYCMWREEKRCKRKIRDQNDSVVFLHIQVCKNALVIIIESEMKSGFSPEMPPLISFSVSQSYLCQELNAVRALKAACALFLMGNIWYSLSNSVMLLSVWKDNQCEAVIYTWKRKCQFLLFDSQFLIIPQGTHGSSPFSRDDKHAPTPSKAGVKDDIS